MTVVPFPAPKRSGPASRDEGRAMAVVRPLQPPQALAPFPAPLPEPYDADEDRLRMRQNVGALLAVLFIVVLGGWLIERLSQYSRTLACLETGHRNCMPLEIEPPRRW